MNFITSRLNLAKSALTRLLIAGAQGSDSASLAFTAVTEARADNRDVLLIDTAGRLQNKAELMVDNPPPATDGAILKVMAPLGLDDFDPGRFSPAEVAAIEAGVVQARADAQRSGLRGPGFINGWTYPYARLGVFAQEYGYRASVAIGGLAALPPEEAMYMRAKGDLPRALFDGRAAWRLHFPADHLLPVNSFWSLCLYEATQDGQFFFADNPLGRYAIGDRSPGLRTNADGSLDIWI
eukprot:gene16229-21508_t